jgi:translation initiation factor IF-1
VNTDWREYVMTWPWRRTLRVYLKDGTIRTGHLKSRNRRGFDLDDSLKLITWETVDAVESGDFA